MLDIDELLGSDLVQNIHAATEPMTYTNRPRNALPTNLVLTPCLPLSETRVGNGRNGSGATIVKSASVSFDTRAGRKR